MMFVVIRPDQAAEPGTAASPGPAADPDPTLASWHRRLIAFVIDGLVLTLVTGALWGRLLASFANPMSQAAAFPAQPAARGAHDAVWRGLSGTPEPCPRRP